MTFNSPLKNTKTKQDMPVLFKIVDLKKRQNSSYKNILYFKNKVL